MNTTIGGRTRYEYGKWHRQQLNKICDCGRVADAGWHAAGFQCSRCWRLENESRNERKVDLRERDPEPEQVAQPRPENSLPGWGSLRWLEQRLAEFTAEAQRRAELGELPA